MPEQKIPVKQVLDDMYNSEGGPISWGARAYYYKYYATPEERKYLDREQLLQRIFSGIFILALFTGVILAIIL